MNGFEGDRSAAEYRLRAGDVALVGLPRLGAEGEAAWSSARSRSRSCTATRAGRAGGRPLRGLAGRSDRLARSDRRRLGRAARDARCRTGRTCSSSVAAPPGRPPSCSAPRPASRSASPQRRSRPLAARYEGPVRPGPAAALLAAAGTAALLADRLSVVASDPRAARRLSPRPGRAPRASTSSGRSRRGLGVLVLSPFLGRPGRHAALGGPDRPGARAARRDDQRAREAALNALRLRRSGSRSPPTRCCSTTTGSSPSAGFARRSALAVALATRLVPTLERDAAGLAEALRGRGVRLEGVRGHATLLSPLVAGSLERAPNLAEAMEARGFGRPGATRAPRPPWSRRDRLALAAPACSSWWRCCGSSVGRAASRSPIRRRRRRSRTSRSSSSRGRSWRCSGPSGSGKSTLLRALAGLVPHFHGGRFAGRVEVAGRDTRGAPGRARGHVATVFQDPEDQVVMARVANEVAFGLENLGVAAGEIWPRVEGALAAVGALHLGAGGRSSSPAASCSASASPPRSRSSRGSCSSTSRRRSSTPTPPRVPRAVAQLGARSSSRSTASARARARDRVLFLEGGRLLLDAPPRRRVDWLAAERRAGRSRVL